MAQLKVVKLDRRIDILERTETKNEYYEIIYEWTTKKTIWCSVKQQYFRDYQDTYGTTLQNTVNFIIRYDAGQFVNKENHILFKGNQYRIEDILEGSFDRDFTTLVCKRVDDKDE